MKIGLPKEIMTGEGRIALTPIACKSLIASGHVVLMENNAGFNSGYGDEEYQSVGVDLLASAQQVYARATLIVKVKQPLQCDLDHLRKHHILFSYLHLAADLSLVQTLCDIGLSAVPFESITNNKGELPLLAPMSQVAGRIAAIRGASLLFKNRGGRGVLLGGVDGSETGRVVVLGAGVAGSQAAAVSAALGAHVDVLDVNESKLKQLALRLPSINTHLSTPENTELYCSNADLVIGAVLLAGRRAPVVLQQSVIEKMHQGSVIVDIAIDQGGCVENIRATSSEKLSYVEHGVIHTAVPNMPATVARTSSQSLSTAILPYVEVLASLNATMDEDIFAVMAASDAPVQSALYHALAIYHGEVVDDVLIREISMN
ncbi:MAG: alanine dehydrogenase [Gammaproteobacteria bacterium]|nr:MAG: alanine dehydrogenase [Gammaproteobacteria bacterium]